MKVNNYEKIININMNNKQINLIRNVLKVYIIIKSNNLLYYKWTRVKLIRFKNKMEMIVNNRKI
jgi:hypothetical protein